MDLVLTVFTPVTTNTQTGNNSGSYQGPMGGPLDTINRYIKESGIQMLETGGKDIGKLIGR